jgi:hypothetical protein
MIDAAAAMMTTRLDIQPPCWLYSKADACLARLGILAVSEEKWPISGAERRLAGGH